MDARRIVIAAGLGVLACSVAGLADCGSIPFEAGVQIHEPDQNALIAWNGKEELLVLSTNLRASKPTKVLEVIPLPSKPAVKAGRVATFREAIRLINEKVARKARGDARLVGKPAGTFGDAGGGRAEPPPPAGVVTFHTTIGATDVSVTRVLNADGFVEWVRTYLKSLKVAAPEIPAAMKKVVGEYLADGYAWFVFNVVDLGRTTRTKQALEYRFASNCIYYPLRITRTETGKTLVTLLILTRETIDGLTFTGIPRWDVRVPEYMPVTISSKEFIGLHLGAYRLLSRPKTTHLRIWEISGELAGFTEDLLAGRAKRFSLRRDTTGKVYGPFRFLDGERINLDGEVFLVAPGRQDQYNPARWFRLKSFRFDRYLGPFRLVNGAKVRLGGAEFTLRTRRARASGGDRRATRPIEAILRR